MKIIYILLFTFGFSSVALPTIRVGAKNFTESYILAEIGAQMISAQGYHVDRRFGLGGSGIIIQALESGAIDVYPSYTGTISRMILRDPSIVDRQDMIAALKKRHLVMGQPLGFNNTYALAVTRKFAKKYDLHTLSDLKKVQSTVRLGLSHEFVNRNDGFGPLKRKLKLKLRHPPILMEHSLALEAISSGKVDVVEVYSTDAKIRSLNLLTLKDDLNYFPRYEPVFLAREDFPQKYPKAWAALNSLKDKFDESKMIELNGEAEVDGKSFQSIAANFLHLDQGSSGNAFWKKLGRRTREHLVMVVLAMAFSALIGIPLGIYASKDKRFGHLVVLVSSLVQTVPSLALLCLLIPFLGIGLIPALVALFLYGLLPVVINTYTGLAHIERRHIEMAQALGLTTWQRLRHVELPLASASIWAGVKTSTIISIGTATLAALIGAGGYGAEILTGLALNDMRIILDGAIPAAAMALVASFALDILGRRLVKKV